MDLIEWSDELSVNVAEIDSQHQTLVSLINELHAAISQHRPVADLEEVFDRLMRYAVTHFETEEKYFERFGYPQTEAHRQEHVAFIKKLTALRARFESSQEGLTVSVFIFLREWLWKHILGSDRQYVPFLREHGVT